MEYTGQAEMLAYYNAARKPDTHKGDYGRVYILAGSYGMTGAAVMCARAALRAGAGLVYMLAPGKLMSTYEILCPEAVKTELDRESEYFTEEHAARAADMIRADLEGARAGAAAKSVAVIGPGIGRRIQTKQFVYEVLSELEGSGVTVVLDADGLNAFTGDSAALKRYACGLVSGAPDNRARLVITPHAAELSRLTGMNIKYINENREEAAFKACGMTGAVTLLKGNRTLTAEILHTGDKICHVNTSGNPGMATGGSGDVLAGIIAGIAASDRSGTPLYDMARCGAYIHGLCGDIAAQRYGQRAVTAGDLIEMLKEVHRYGM